MAGRTAAVELGLALRLSTTSAQYRIGDSTRAVADHPELLGLVGTGVVSMAGLRRVLAATDVLDGDRRRQVDAQLAGEVTRSRLTPAQLDKAAQRRVLAADPAAADNRAAKARTRDRCVRLGDPVDGTAGLFARLRAEEALAAFARLDRTARGMRRDGDQRTIDTLMADLLTEWLTGTPLVRTDRPTGPPTEGAAADSEADRPTEGWPVWRSCGEQPWTWSDPPPWPAADAGGDPEPADQAWDTYLTGEPAYGPAGGPGGTASRTRDHRDQGAGRPSGDSNDADDAVGPVGAEQMAAHPAHGPPGWRRPGGVEVQVLIGAGTLLGLDDSPGLLRGHGAVSAEVIRDLVDTAHATGAPTLRRGLFCDPADGRLLAMDANGRYFTGELRQFALWRDQHCRLTGTRIVDIDHALGWAAGGTTTAANSQGLGKLAHLVKDHPDMHVGVQPRALAGDGLDHLRVHAPDLCWTTPAGRTYTQPPPPALGHGSHPEPEPEPPDQPR